MKKIITSVVIIGLAALFLFRGLLNYKSNKASKILPYYGNKDLASNGKDTIYHYVPDFKFINQEGKTITQKNMVYKTYGDKNDAQLLFIVFCCCCCFRCFCES